MSIDIGWGSDSATAIMVSRFVNGKVQILYSKEFFRSLFQDIIDEVWRLKNKCHGNLKCILMDASATELYTTLCNEFNQNLHRNISEINKSGVNKLIPILCSTYSSVLSRLTQ